MKLESKWYGLYLILAGFSIGAVSGCGGSGVAASAAPAATAQAQPPPAQVHAQSLDTAQLLEQARRTSETADPYAVDGGALTLDDTSDSTEPLLVNAI
jgi:hypothetical protein